MRPLTDAQQAIADLGTPDYSHRIRIRVDRTGSGDWVDLHNYLGVYNLIRGCDWEESLDNNVATARVSLVRKIGTNINLAPLITGSVVNLDSGGSYDALLETGNKIEIRAAVATQANEPADEDFLFVFDGLIDSVSTSENGVEVRCRDASSVLLSDYVEEVTVYGADGGSAVEDEMQDILDDHAADSWTLEVPTSPSWQIERYAQRKEPVMTALRKLAQQIGWDVRYRVRREALSSQVTERFSPGWNTVTLSSATSSNPDAFVNVSGTDRVVLVAIAVDTVSSIDVNSVTLDSAPLTKIQSLDYTPSFNSELSLWYIAENDISPTNPTSQLLSISLSSGSFGARCEICVLEGCDSISPIKASGASSGSSPQSVGSLSHEAGDAVVAVGYDDPTLSSSSPSGLTADGTDPVRGGNIFPTSSGTATVSASNGTVGIIGAVIRAKQVSGFSETPELALTEPPRSKTTPDAVIPVDLVLAQDAVQVDTSTVRNKIRIVFLDGDTRTTYVAQDSASQTKYGVRFMEIVEGASSNIDSTAEATDMADAILSDLKDPVVRYNPTLPFRPWVELNDLLRFKANGEEFSTDLDLAVMAVRHRITPGGASTQLTMQGRPSSGWRRWFELEARPGVGSGTKTDVLGTPSNGSAAPELGGIRVEFDEPTEIDWAYSEVHLSTSSGFTPSSTTLKTTTRTNQVQIGGLTLGATFYVKIIHVDTEGNRSTPSAQILVATELVTSYHKDREDPDSGAAINRNFNFGTFTKGTDTYPDSWGVDYNGNSAGAWTTGSTDDQWSVNSSDSFFGGRSIAYNGRSTLSGAAGSRMSSDRFPIKGDAFYGVEILYKDVDEESNYLTPTIFWYNSAGSFISETLGEVAGDPSGRIFSSSGDWEKAIVYFVAPATAAYAQVVFRVDPGITGPNILGEWRFDLVRLFEAVDLLDAIGDGASTRAAANGAWTTPSINGGVQEDRSGGFVSFFSGSHSWTAAVDGEYQITGAVGFAIGPSSCRARLTVNGGTVGASAYNEGLECTVSASIKLEAGDTVRLQGRQDSGSSVNFEDDECRLIIKQIGDLR